MKFKVKMRSELLFIETNTLYESIILALGVAFGSGSTDGESVKARTPEQLQREMEAMMNP